MSGYNKKNIVFFCLNIFFTFLYSVDPDEMHYAAFHLGLHYLQKYSFRVFPYTFTNRIDPDEMLHFIRVYIVKVEKIFRQNIIFFEIYDLTPLDMYNGLSQAYCIKPKGRIH